MSVQMPEGGDMLGRGNSKCKSPGAGAGGLRGKHGSTTKVTEVGGSRAIESQDPGRAMGPRASVSTRVGGLAFLVRSIPRLFASSLPVIPFLFGYQDKLRFPCLDYCDTVSVRNSHWASDPLNFRTTRNA